MTPESILKNPPKVLKQSLRKKYFSEGFLFLENMMDKSMLRRLHLKIGQAIEESRVLKSSNKKFDLEPDHSNELP